MVVQHNLTYGRTQADSLVWYKGSQSKKQQKLSSDLQNKSLRNVVTARSYNFREDERYAIKRS